MLNVQVTAYGRQTVSDRGVVRSCDPLQNFWGSNHITGMAEPKVVKFCARVGYINSNNRMTCCQQKRRGYCHVTVLKFCCLSWCSPSRGFVSDSWATCHYKLMKRCCHLQLRANFFSFRVVNLWNRLSSDVISAPSVNAFKSRLDNYGEDYCYMLNPEDCLWW